MYVQHGVMLDTMFFLCCSSFKAMLLYVHGQFVVITVEYYSSMDV